MTRVRFFHFLFVLIAVLVALTSGVQRDLRFLLLPKQTEVAQVISSRSLFPRGAQYYEVTATLPGQPAFIVDADFPGREWSVVPRAGDQVILRCTLPEKQWCRPPGFYFTWWKVWLKLSPLLLSVALLIPKVQVGCRQILQRYLVDK